MCAPEVTKPHHTAESRAASNVGDMWANGSGSTAPPADPCPESHFCVIGDKKR